MKIIYYKLFKHLFVWTEQHKEYKISWAVPIEFLVDSQTKQEGEK